MNYKVIDCDGDGMEVVLENVSAVNLDALIAKMEDVEIEKTMSEIAMFNGDEEVEGCGVSWRLTLTCRGDNILLTAIHEPFGSYEEEYDDEEYDDEYDYDKEAEKYHENTRLFTGEKWMNLYKLLVKEAKMLKGIDPKSYEDGFLEIVPLKEQMAISITALAIFKEFVDEIENFEDHMDFGFYEMYEAICSPIFSIVEIIEE